MSGNKWGMDELRHAGGLSGDHSILFWSEYSHLKICMWVRQNTL